MLYSLKIYWILILKKLAIYVNVHIIFTYFIYNSLVQNKTKS